jgi:hypothetical protein
VLKNSPVDYFNEGASWREDINSNNYKRDLDGGFENNTSDED